MFWVGYFVILLIQLSMDLPLIFQHPWLRINNWRYNLNVKHRYHTEIFSKRLNDSFPVLAYVMQNVGQLVQRTFQQNKLVSHTNIRVYHRKTLPLFNHFALTNVQFSQGHIHAAFKVELQHWRKLTKFNDKKLLKTNGGLRFYYFALRLSSVV